MKKVFEFILTLCQNGIVKEIDTVSEYFFSGGIYMKRLVTYFSASGVTKRAAEQLAQLVYDFLSGALIFQYRDPDHLITRLFLPYFHYSRTTAFLLAFTLFLFAARESAHKKL